MRTIILDPWEEYRRYRFDSPTAIDYHTEFYEPQVALDTVEQLMCEIDTTGHQFDPGLRAISGQAWGAL